MAVDAARSARESWRKTPRSERCRLLTALADRVARDAERFAVAETVDNGKPITLSRTVDIPRAIANLRFFATAILHDHDEAYATDGQALHYVLRTPRGIAGCISPWNLPIYLFTWKIAPALAAGCPVVAKPSELTPMTATMLAEAAIEVGFPPGVFNLVHGRGDQAGSAIVSHPEITSISFTGGTVTGARIAQTAAPMFKKLSLELGGKNANIVFADADFDHAVSESVRASFANQGQICLCGSRILVERAIYARFVDAFVARAAALACGDPLEAETKQGALVSAAHREKVERCLHAARQEGGRVIVGGRRPQTLPERCRDGFFLEPAVIVDLPHRCATNAEEIFGPVVTIAPFDLESEAIGAANATRYGLSATIFTRDLPRAHRAAAQLDAGTVWINTWLFRDLRVPFGGMKESGVGREGGYDALRFFCETKTVCVRTEPC